LASEAALQYSPNFLCGDCRIVLPDFDCAFSVARYDGVLREAIHQFKFYQKIGLGKYFVQLLISYMPDNIEWASYQTILPVPLYKKRQRERGYNQAAILARNLAQRYRLNFIQNNLIRIRHTEAQWSIKERGQRQANVKNAFRLRFPSQVQDQHLILIDDVFTTGATVNECAKTLKKAGAKSVLVLTVARAGLDSQ
jgi:ComF family protein